MEFQDGLGVSSCLSRLIFYFRNQTHQAGLRSFLLIVSLAILPCVSAASDTTSDGDVLENPHILYALSSSYPNGIAARISDDISLKPGYITLMIILGFFISATHLAEVATAYMSDCNRRTRYFSIFFTLRKTRLRLPTLIWGAMSIAALSLAGAFWSSVSAAETCEVSAVDADVAGIGVRVNVWVSGGVAILMLLLGHLHPEPTGVKEVNLALLYAQIYYTLNLIIGFNRGMAAMDVFIAGMILDALTTLVSITFSMKESLASRIVVRCGFLSQFIALATIGTVISRLPSISAASEFAIDAEGPPPCHCYQAYWWGPADTCTGVSPSFWLYFAGKSLTWVHDCWLCLWYTGRYDAAEKAERDDDNTSVMVSKAVFDFVPATAFTKYQEWIALLACTMVNFELTLRKYGIQALSGWKSWGQTAQLVVTVGIVVRWGYGIQCMLYKKKNAKRRTEVLTKFKINAKEARIGIKGFWARVLEFLDKSLPEHPFYQLPLKSVDHARITSKGWEPMGEPEDLELKPLPPVDSGKLGVQLIQEAKFGDALKVKELLLNGADVKKVDDEGRSALMYAALNGHNEVVRLLLEEDGVEIDLVGSGAGNALNMAAMNGNVGVVRLLLGKGIYIQEQDKHQRTALHLAARNGHKEVVEILLDNGASMAALSAYGYTALLDAAEQGHVEVVRVLLSRGVDITVRNQNGRTALNIAAGKGHQEIVNLLLASGADPATPDNNGGTSLHRAAMAGHQNTVEALLTRGADSDKPVPVGNTRGMAEISLNADVKALVHARDTERNTALHYAAGTGNLQMTKALLSLGADIAVLGGNRDTPLHRAAAGGHTDIVSLLLSYGATTEVQDKFSNTALHDAARRGHGSVVKVLLSSGTDLAITDKDKRTALHLAAGSGAREVVELLLEKGANVDARDRVGNTALSYAAAAGHGGVVELLLAGGADFKVADMYGRTPLHDAAERNHEEVVRLLLEYGADPATPDRTGKTAVQIARGHRSIVGLLGGSPSGMIRVVGWESNISDDSE